MPMSEAELRALLRPEGESETLEYKREPQEPEEFAKSLVSLANTRGGRIIVGVNDAGRVAGHQDPKFEEWVASVARDKVSPPLAPAVDRHPLAEGNVFVVDVPPRPEERPYARVHHGHRSYFVRVGRTWREASAEELLRLFQASGRLHLEEMPVRGTSISDIDGQALRSYVKRVFRRDLAGMEAAERGVYLCNLGLLHAPEGPSTVAGILLFSDAPQEHVPENGVIVARFSGDDIASPLQDREEITGRLPGLVDTALRVVKARLVSGTRRRGGRLARGSEIPDEALREALVNAVVHRDYTLRARKVRVLILSDRVEVRSPGPPPNTITVARMVEGSVSIPRNHLLFTAMAHMGYVEQLGMGVRRIIEATRRAHRPATVEIDVDETVVRFPRRA